jgi:hypothetical protein
VKRGTFEVPTATGWKHTHRGTQMQYGLVRWFWSRLEVKVKKSHKGCGPDCSCWRKV